MRKAQRAVAGQQKRSLAKVLLPTIFAATALVALWQHLRVRRSMREAHRPVPMPLPADSPRVSIIVPMRNEAAHLDACLASLCAQDYPDFEIMVIDDGSSDETPQLLAQWAGRDPRVRVRRVEQLPAGWAGKAHAMHTAVTLTRGEWLLFTDADTCHAAHALRVMMGYALRRRVDFLSLWPNMMTLGGPAMPLLWPITTILLALRVTPAEIENPTSARAFGFGQYILMRRASYLATGGYEAPGMRTTAIDDLALAEQIKQAGGRIEIVNGRGLITNTQWTSWRSARQGWVKSCHGELVRANLALVSLPGALAFLLYGLGPLAWPLYALMTGKIRRFSTLAAAFTLSMQIATKRLVDRDYDLPPGWSLTAPLGWATCGFMILDVARLLLSRKSASWKGRQLPPQERAARAKRGPGQNVLHKYRWAHRDYDGGGSSGEGSEAVEDAEDDGLESICTCSSTVRSASSWLANSSRKSACP